MSRCEVVPADTYEPSPWSPGEEMELAATTFDLCNACEEEWAGLTLSKPGIDNDAADDEALAWLKPGSHWPDHVLLMLEGGVDHPPYEETWPAYTCLCCDAELTAEDD